MKPINKTNHLDESNMMTNKEVVSIQKLRSYRQIQKGDTLLHMCIKPRQEESEWWQ